MSTAAPVAPHSFLGGANTFFDQPLGTRGRLIVLTAALLLIPTFLFPLWNMTLFSNQFPDGLDLHVYSYALAGGHTAARDDLREINTLNHYIGMRPLLESDFSEFTWLPLMIGIFFILALRAVVIGKMASLVDTAVLFLYASLFSLWSFYHRLYMYGHNLSPDAPVKVKPFMPPMLGTQQLANFQVEGYPGLASLFLIAFLLLLTLAIFLSGRQVRAQ
jgi:copper chaperone NosL